MRNEEQTKDNLMEDVIERWTEQYPPAGGNDKILKLTSYDIAEELAEFVETSPGDVTRILMGKGYRLERTSNGKMVWLIKGE